MTPYVSCFRSAKANAKTAISAHAVQMQTTPFRQLLAHESSPISSPCWTPGVAPTGTSLRSESTESLSAYNKAMDEIASKVARLLGEKHCRKKGSITFRKQLKTAWLFVLG